MGTAASLTETEEAVRQIRVIVLFFFFLIQAIGQEEQSDTTKHQLSPAATRAFIVRESYVTVLKDNKLERTPEAISVQLSFYT